MVQKKLRLLADCSDMKARMNYAGVFILVLTVLVWLNCAAQSEIQGQLDQMITEEHYPGISLGLINKDGEVHSMVSGWADRELAIPMTSDNKLLGGSTGKTFVAAILMQLMEENKISKENYISKWLGDDDWFSQLPNNNKLTVKHLLQHQSGLERYEFKPEFTNDVLKDASKVWRPEELISYVLGDKPLFEPGDQFSYSDTNYILLGMIIERIEGKPYYQVLNDRLLEPLGLLEVVPTNSLAIDNLAQGYTGDKDPLGYNNTILKNGRSKYNLQFEWTGGGLAFKTVDYAKWLKVLFEGGAFDWDKMSTQFIDVVDSPEIGGQYGIGFQVYNFEKIGKAFGHSGFFPGYFTMGVYIPEKKIAIAMQVNTSQTEHIKFFYQDFTQILQQVVNLN